MFFFDSNCSIGMRSIIIKGSFYDIETLLNKMKICNIQDAMVYYSLSEEYHPIVGNEKLIKDIEKHNSLHPVWVIMPNNTGEFYDPLDLIKMMKTNDVKMVKAFPGKSAHNYSFSSWGCGKLLGMLNDHKIPLMIGMEQLDYDIIYNLARDYKSLPLILTNVGYRADRYLYPLLEKYCNIYIETSSYKVYFGIEAICAIFGARRFVFGTGLPVYSAGSAVTMITHLTIKDEEKAMIAGDNMKWLLGDVSYE